jgi:hypothetical protein
MFRPRTKTRQMTPTTVSWLVLVQIGSGGSACGGRLEESKWLMKRNPGKQHGPPFKKIGRLVRYPEEDLQGYING